jgi:hypothetical protein
MNFNNLLSIHRKVLRPAPVLNGFAVFWVRVIAQFGGNIYGYLYLLDNWVWHLHNVKGSYITKSAENLNHEYDYKPRISFPVGQHVYK